MPAADAVKAAAGGSWRPAHEHQSGRETHGGQRNDADSEERLHAVTLGQMVGKGTGRDALEPLAVYEHEQGIDSVALREFRTIGGAGRK